MTKTPADAAPRVDPAPADLEGVERLSQLVSGNTHLISEPGLVKALYDGNATPIQAGAIDQFVGGLKAEARVRTAAAAGVKINLSNGEQSALDSMQVDYSGVLHAEVPPVVKLKQQMAQHGLQPSMDANGKVITDKKGNVQTEPLDQYAAVIGGAISGDTGQTAQDSGLLGAKRYAPVAFSMPQAKPQEGFFSPITNALGEAVHEISKFSHDPTKPNGPSGFAQTSGVASAGYNVVNSTVSQGRQEAMDPAAAVRAAGQKAELMQRLGYDPNSTLSNLDFESKGYAFNDNSGAAAKWDEKHPQGMAGMDGNSAVTEAEAFLDDPDKYVSNIAKTGTPEQAAQKLAFANSSEFEDLVKRVAGNKSTVGTDFARELGIDPVKHSTIFKSVSTAADIAASFVADPIAVGAGVYTGIQRTSVAIKNFNDAEGITRILRAGTDAEGAVAHATAAQTRTQLMVRNMVDIGKRAVDADEAGDTVKLAQIQAEANANPIGGLLADFMGKDQILRTKTAAQLQSEVERGVKDVTPHVFGSGEPIDTYDKAVEYLASKAALFRLTAGKAPVEFSTMPGAMSSYGYSKFKGSLMSWSTGRTAEKTERAVAKLVGRAEADPASADALINDNHLTRILPAQDDAVDMLSSRVLAAREAGDTEGLASAQRALADRQAQLEESAPIAATDATRGQVRANQLRYGLSTEPKTAVAKIASIYTLGAARRMSLIVTRMSNLLPRTFTVDVTNAADSDTIRKVARTYLTSGDSNMLAARWATGSADTRKAIVQGVRDQINHAAGLSRTAAGREYMTEQAAREEHYATNGVEWTDRNGGNAAQWPGQMQTEFSLPRFGQIHKAAAKVGLYEGTMGRLLNSNAMDRLLSLWRTGILGSPVTANRATAEALLVAHLDTDFGLVKSLAAKAVMKDTGLLSVKGLHRSRVAEGLANTAGFRDVGRLYRSVLKKSLSEDEINALKTMDPDVALDRMLQQSRSHWAQEVDPSNTLEATQIAELGLKPTQVTYNTKQGFDAILRTKKGYEVTEELDAQAGANAYAFTLGSRVNASPNVAKAVLDRIEDPEQFEIEHVVKALDKEPLMNDSLYGKVLRVGGQQTEAHTADDIAEAKRQWAENLVDDMGQLMTGRNGAFQHHLADEIRAKGHAPDADWIQDNIKGLDRPQKVLRPQWAAVIPELTGEETLADATQKMAEAVQNFNGKIYQWSVERLIQRNSTSPLYGLAYAKAKVSLADLKDAYIGSGLTHEAAESITAKIADKQAWNRIALMVDDPALKLQMDVAGRSFFAFSRATTSMLRRWGAVAWKNPAQARRLQLAYEGANQSGLIYHDESGQPMFLLPLSGVGQEVIFHAMSHIPGLEGMASFPTSDFQGRVASIIPGSNNPFQYNTTPFVSIGGRWLASLVPNHRELFDEMDAKLNGTQGQGQGLMSTMLPRLAKQFTDAELSDGRDSTMNSAMVGALFNLYASGHVPKDGASPAELQQFYDRLKVGTQSMLGVRFLLGSISPATLTTPQGATKPDFAYAARGVKTMKDEFTKLVNDTDGDWARALSIWTYAHPDDSVFTQSSSTGKTKNAALAATDEAYHWMATNHTFVDKYKSVAAYFVPEQKPGQQFSMEAYRAQLEQGFRERKTPQEFLDGVRIASASTPYYEAEDDFNNRLAKAQSSGDDGTAKQLRAAWDTWSKGFKALHPTFADHLAGASQGTATAQGQLRDLRYMVKNDEVPGSTRVKQAVTNMITAYDGYRNFQTSHPGSTNAAEAVRKAATAKLQEFMTTTVTAVPELRDLYNGTFRPLNEQLDYAS